LSLVVRSGKFQLSMARQRKGAGSALEFHFVNALGRALRTLGLERAVRVGGKLGGAVMSLDRLNRPVAERNLEIAFPDSSREARLKILRQSYANWGRMFAEFVNFDRFTVSNIGRYVTYDGLEHFERGLARAHPMGCFILSAHFGNFELLSAGHALLGSHRIAVMHRPLRNVHIDAAVRANRARFGNQSLDRRGGGRASIRLLREGWLIAVALDLDVRRGVFVDFFSMPASTNEGLARLAMATEIPVIPAFIVRQGASARHRITVLPEIEIVRDGDRDDAVVENTRRFTAAIESMVARHPDHWNWVHRRWKTRPPGEPRFY
jgi:KDO2-lipid IV(A) lauroyltransferase